MKLSSILNFTFFRLRWKILTTFNALFFGGVFTTLVLAGVFLPPPLYTSWQVDLPGLFLNGSWLVLMLGIFIFNFALNSFVFITLPGIILFPLSAGFLLYRAFVWGLLLNTQPLWPFAIYLLVLAFEGESYVLAAVAGTVFGESWIRYKLAYPGDELSRTMAVKKASKEIARMYILICVLLFAAAAIETVTMAMSL